MAYTPPAPDLQSILANLAQLAQPAQSQGSQANVEKDASLDNSTISEHGKQDDASPTTRPSVEDPRLRPQSQSTASPKPMIDPATITTWQDGLRCVTKLAAQNGQFGASIRRMIEEQKRNELRWYSERQNLKQTQVNRGKSSAQAQSILQSLSNGPATVAYQIENGVDSEAELDTLDRKIYAAQVAMEASMTSELKALGVPFFGTDRSAVMYDTDGPLPEGSFIDRPKWSPLVTETQLLELRKRMIGHLEDLYRD